MKNKLKKMVLGMAIGCSIPMFVACGGKPTLATPKNLSIDEDTYLITWDEVKNADYYLVEINGKTYKSTEESFPAHDLITAGGVYNIRVVAHCKDDDYKNSHYTEFIVTEYFEQFATPVLSESDGVVSWEPIDNAEFYVVVVNGVKIEVTETQFNLREQNELSKALIKGTQNSIKVYVPQTNNNLKSEASNEVFVYLAGEQQSPKNLAIKEENDKYILTFDGVETAQTYTLKINESEYQIYNNSVDITEYISQFGIYNISVSANAVYEGSILKYYSSLPSSILEYELVPNFVGQTINNLQINDGILTFDEIEDASKYVITIGQTSLESATNQFDLLQFNLTAGVYNVSVVAQNGSYENNASTIEYVVTEKLAKPTILVKSENDVVMLTISHIQNSQSYKVKVNSNEFTTSDLATDITNYIIDGANSIEVTALGDGKVYLNSDPATTSFVELGIPQNLQVTNGILSFDSVNGATAYVVSINNSLLATIVETQLDISSYIANPNKYQISVSAKLDEYEGASVTITYITSTTLSAPANLQLINQNGRVMLTFDLVGHANSYDLFVNRTRATNITSSTDITDYLSLGENEIYLIAVGDGEVYLSSMQSQSLTYVLTKELNQATNIQVTANAGKYYLSFDDVDGATSYLITIANSRGDNVFIQTLTDSSNIDIDTAITSTENYNITITAKSDNQYLTDSVVTLTEQIKAYLVSEYSSKEFFYEGHDYTYCVNSQYELEEFVLYAVLYRLNGVEVYVNFDYDGLTTAYTSSTSAIDKYLPSVSKFGVDLNSNTDVIAQLFNLSNISRIKEIVELIERVHDQMYLYYDVSSQLTSQKSNRVYTLNFDYKGDYEGTLINNKSDVPQANLPVAYTEQVNSRIFAIDSKQEVPVETVSQLMMAVENNKKPLFVKTQNILNYCADEKTIAEQTYLKAKEVLSKICTDNMTEYQKALAIYDWVISNNTYDYETYTNASGAPFSEDNLSDMSFFASGMLLNNLAVCKGIEEAFSLMCNIEGIQTVSTFGLTGGTSDWSNVDWDNMFSLMSLDFTTICGHCWNRIYLDPDGDGVKEWYVVDPTWGDIEISKTEYLSHEYFLVNDTKIASNRKEFYPFGTYYKPTDEQGNVIDYSATSDYNYYKDTTNKTISYVTTQLDLDAVVENMVQTNETGFEVYFDSAISTNSITTMIGEALSNNSLLSTDYQVTKNGRYVFVVKK